MLSFAFFTASDILIITLSVSFYGNLLYVVSVFQLIIFTDHFCALSSF
jgi:hypothetical protein